jgi:hypothetical protein
MFICDKCLEAKYENEQKKDEIAEKRCEICGEIAWGADYQRDILIPKVTEAQTAPEVVEPGPPFVIVPLLRGFSEIKKYYQLAQKHGATICGGFARYCASPVKDVAKAGDVDFFPQSEESATALLEDLKAMGFVVKHENHVSYTLEPGKDAIGIGYLPTPQVIKPMIEGKIVTLGTPEEILQNFDFTIVRAAILNEDEVLVDCDFIVDEIKRKLCLKNIHCPISSTLRCCKYARKGYWMPPSEALKLFMEWDARGDEYKIKLLELFKASEKGEATEDNPFGMTREQIDELEALLRID